MVRSTQLFKCGRSPPNDANDALLVYAPLVFLLGILCFIGFGSMFFFFSIFTIIQIFFLKISKISTEKSLITFTFKTKALRNTCLFLYLSHSGRRLMSLHIIKLHNALMSRNLKKRRKKGNLSVSMNTVEQKKSLSSS